MDWLNKEIELQNKLDIIQSTYIGIDFGTSTSVVSCVTFSNNQAAAEPIFLNQPEEYGGTLRHYLVNSVLAWRNKKLLWGQDAYRLKPILTDGVNVFSSFKMKLGLSIGPTYPNTMLSSARGQEVIIETAEDASYQFFNQLIGALKQEVGKNALSQYRFAFSVPASFEANQRRALLESLFKNGIEASQCCLIDEPNAAFLSFLQQCFLNNEHSALLEKLKSQSINLLVYDFGAGTCDISILQVGIQKNKISSRNLAISKFTALGGDDIDRAIARLLAHQLLADTKENLSTRDIDEFLIPKLQAAAERLKISINAWLSQQNICSLSDCYEQNNIKFEDLPMSVKIKDKELATNERSYLYLYDFAEIVEEFLGDYDESYSVKHIMSPVYDAMRKVGLVAEDLAAVLFIGGSSKSPLVQSCVKRELTKYGEEIDFIVPKDLQSHVSLGAAIHSVSYFGLGLDLISPITSEAIYIITQNDSMALAIPASSLVPSDKPFVLDLMVKNDEQNLIDLPLCVGNKNKLLGVLSIESYDSPFKKGDKVQVRAQINHEKLLLVEATINEQIANTKILNPLANQELTASETKLLKVRQNFNQAILDNKGRPPVYIVEEYAEALEDAGEFEKSADMYVALERLKESDHATQICYLYSRAGKNKESNHWAKVAHKRKPCDVTAYNVACGAYDQKETIKYLRESLKHNPNYTSALMMLGQILHRQGDMEGGKLLETAKQNLQTKWIQSERDLRDLIEVSELLGDCATKTQAEQKLNAYQSDEQVDNLPYSQDNLLDGVNVPIVQGDG